MKNKQIARQQRIKKRVRSRIVRQSEFPRLSVHKSNNHIYAQLINDFDMKTLAQANDVKLEGSSMNRIAKAQEVGKMIGAEIKKLKIAQVVFDRGCYPYKGRVKALADAVRETGIII